MSVRVPALAALDAFYLEHRLRAELEGGVDRAVDQWGSGVPPYDARWADLVRCGGDSAAAQAVVEGDTAAVLASWDELVAASDPQLHTVSHLRKWAREVVNRMLQESAATDDPRWRQLDDATRGLLVVMGAEITSYPWQRLQ